MKYLFLATILCLSLCSCRQVKEKRAHDVMMSKKSLVNRWYGPDHFKPAPESEEDQLMTDDSANESTEIDAGKVKKTSSPTEINTGKVKKTSKSTTASVEPQESPVVTITSSLAEIPTDDLEAENNALEEESIPDETT